MDTDDDRHRWAPFSLAVKPELFQAAIVGVGWPSEYPRGNPQRTAPHEPLGRSTFGCAVVFGVVIAAGCAVTLWGRANARNHETDLRAKCHENLTQLGIALKTYAAANHGQWPDLSPGLGILQFAKSTVPDYLLICPTQREAPHVRGYYYLGYRISSDDEAEAFVAAVCARATGEGAYSRDLQYVCRHGARSVCKLSDGDGENPGMPTAQIPVVIEKASNHYLDGMHVLYQDGHVEYIRLGERFPASRRTLSALSQLEPALYPGSSLAPLLRDSFDLP